MGLATEMVFSGKRRQELRNRAAYERLHTDELLVDRDTDRYDDVVPDKDDQHVTEFLMTQDLSGVREAVANNDPAKQPDAATSVQPQQNYSNYQPTSFNAAHEETNTTSEPFTLTILILTVVGALGIFVILGLLVLRFITGV